nr:hypothetical protein [Tanacetum cinerariifolium]
MLTKIELTLEQSQQGVSNDVLVSIEEVEELKRNIRHHGPSDALHNPSQPFEFLSKETSLICHGDTWRKINKKRTKSERNLTKTGSVEKPGSVEDQSQSRKQKREENTKSRDQRCNPRSCIHSRTKTRADFAILPKINLKGQFCHTLKVYRHKDQSCVNPLIDHHCCYECGNSLNDFFCYQCTYEFCGNGAHCQPKNHDYYQEQNSCYDSNSFGLDHGQPPRYTVNHPIFNREEKRIEEEQVAKAQNWKLPVCYDDDDDEERSNSLQDNIIFGLPSCSAIIPHEPVDSLSMRDEHLNTILTTESDEFIKSCVENIVPNPKEFVSENSNANIESFSPSPIPVEDSDSRMEEIDLTFTPNDPMPPSIEEDDYDSERDILILEELPSNYSLSLPEIESFYFDILSFSHPPAKPPDGNTGILNIKMMGGVSDQKVPIPGLTITRLSSIPGNLKTLAKGFYPPSLHFLSFNWESYELIKSNVENLVPIPSEFEGIPDTMCDVHLVNNHTPLEAKDHFEIVINSNDDISSSDDDSLYNENIEYVEASPHDSEVISLEAAEIVIPKVEEIEDDNLREISSGSTTTRSDISLPDYEAFSFNNDHIKESSSGSTTTHSYVSLSEYDLFVFDPSNDQFPLTNRRDFANEEFVDELAHIISPSEYDCFYFWNLPDPGELMSIFNFGICGNLSTTSVNLPVEDDYSPLLTYVVWIFLAYLTYPVIPPYLYPLGNEDTIFDPGITINHFYSFKPGLPHRCGAFKKFNTHRSHLNEWPMIINGKNITILDVLLFHFYPLDQVKYRGN